jgi:predicted enzyme related to lactoylglutathione lyase
MPNSIVHFEIIGKNPAKLRAFYSALFDWTFDTDHQVAPEVSAVGQYGFITPPRMPVRPMVASVAGRSSNRMSSCMSASPM